MQGKGKGTKEEAFEDRDQTVRESNGIDLRRSRRNLIASQREFQVKSQRFGLKMHRNHHTFNHLSLSLDFINKIFYTAALEAVEDDSPKNKKKSLF